MRVDAIRRRRNSGRVRIHSTRQVVLNYTWFSTRWWRRRRVLGFFVRPSSIRVEWKTSSSPNWVSPFAGVKTWSETWQFVTDLSFPYNLLPKCTSFCTYYCAIAVRFLQSPRSKMWSSPGWVSPLQRPTTESGRRKEGDGRLLDVGRSYLYPCPRPL